MTTVIVRLVFAGAFFVALLSSALSAPRSGATILYTLSGAGILTAHSVGGAAIKIWVSNRDR